MQWRSIAQGPNSKKAIVWHGDALIERKSFFAIDFAAEEIAAFLGFVQPIKRLNTVCEKPQFVLEPEKLCPLETHLTGCGAS